MSQRDEHQLSGRALVICADPATWNTVKRILTSEGYDAKRCGEAEQVLATVGDEPPAVIFVDSGVSHSDSLTLCAAVRRLSGCDYVPLILLSGDGSAETAQRAYDAGVTTVFSRPLDQDALRRHVRSLGDTGRTLSGMRALGTTESQVLRTMPDAIFICGKNGTLRQYLGGADGDPILMPAAIEGKTVDEAWPADVARLVRQNVRRVLRIRDGHAFEFELSRDGIRGRYEMRLLVQGRDRVLMIIRNVSAEAVDRAGGEGRPPADTLTGLTGRDAFMARFESMIAEAKLRERGIAVLCIDIDGFARINDTLGRAVGDAVLRVTGKRIERCLRGSDPPAPAYAAENAGVTRIGGDEFVLTLTDVESREDIDSVAARVQDAFEEPITVAGHELDVSPSIGISLYPMDGQSADDLLKNARVALDEARMRGTRDRRFYSDTTRFRAVGRPDVKNELRWAIEKGQLELRYLPRIDLTTGRAAGLEALLRWMHPLRGSVPLSEVIPLAEATGLILPIGDWVLETACAQARSWREAHSGVPPVSINLSQQEFSRNDLASLVRQAVEKAGLPAQRLELELTEGMLMRNRRADAILRELDDVGVGIVLDDFGQGHSSIAHLTRLPIKAIKIDRDFINGVREPGEKQAICSAMIAMCRELGIGVIAEGVESEGQAEFLYEKGCDAVQGFLYSEPLAADAVPAFLTACDEVAKESEVIDLDTVRYRVSVKTSV